MAFSQVNLSDPTYTFVTATISTMIEQSIGIICACLPTTRPLFGRLLHNIKNSSGDETDKQKVAHSSSVPLSNYTSRSAVNGPGDMISGGFERLSEENALEIGSVIAHASTAAKDELPIVTDRIVRQKRVEQQVEHRL